MILGQLIQAGRRFCECRSQDFVPADGQTLTSVAYTVHDQLALRSFEADASDLLGGLERWLNQEEAVAYLLLQRTPCDHSQIELPFPFSEGPMDRLTMIAATHSHLKVVDYFLKPLPDFNAYRLLPARRTAEEDNGLPNLIRRELPTAEERQIQPWTAFFEFA